NDMASPSRVSRGSFRSGNQLALWCQATSLLRLFDDFFQLADFLLYFPGNLLNEPFGFQVGVVRGSSNLFLNFAFPLVKLAFCFVLCALFHRSSPWARFRLRVAAASLSQPPHLQTSRS